MANRGGTQLLLPAALIGGATAVVNQTLMLVVGVPAAWSGPIVSVLLGFCSALLAPRLAYPAPALALMGITGALLPGLVVYHGLVYEVFHKSGSAFFVSAAVTCAGLGIGTAFGFILASLPSSRTS